MFSQVIGLKQICCFLKQTIEKKRLSASYLFVGPSGRGKSFLAASLAKAILCEQEKACQDCPSCQLFAEQLHPDFLVIKAKNNFIQLGQIQELKTKISLFPSVSKKRLILIKNVEKMNLESGNAFLKILEEPPTDNYFVLTTTSKKMVLQTIQSRCHKIYFSEFSHKELKELLAKKITQEDFVWMLPFHREGLKKDWLDNYEKIALLRKQLWESLSKLNFRSSGERTTALLNESQNWAKDPYMFFAALNFVAAFFYDLKILAFHKPHHGEAPNNIANNTNSNTASNTNSNTASNTNSNTANNTNSNTASNTEAQSPHQLLYCEDLKKQTQMALKHYDLTRISDFFDSLVLTEKNLQNFANKNLGWTSVVVAIKRLLKQGESI